MFHQLVSRNNDIRDLLDKGYAIAFDSNYLVVRDIPYLDAEGKLQIGAFVTKLEFIDQERVKQQDHQIFFAGSVPHGLDGKPIPNLGGGTTQLVLSDASKDVIVQRSFSNKRLVDGKLVDFASFFDKIEHYTVMISGPAIQRFDVTPYTFRAVKEIVPDSVFKVHDTLTSRAEIGDLSARFKDDVVAVIGLGGTGAYVLDFLVRTPVREIRAFDFDSFHVHNAFRSPGKLELSELGTLKADVYRSRYENFRHRVVITRKFIEGSCSDDFNGVTFAFVCVDKGTSRAGIFELLVSRGIPFIDVGMGLNRKRGPINGMLRTTYYPGEEAQKVRDKGWAELADPPDDVYRTNTQIGELNALNACMAVIRFKQLRGFYFEEKSQLNVLFRIGDLGITGKSTLDEN